MECKLHISFMLLQRAPAGWVHVLCESCRNLIQCASSYLHLHLGIGMFRTSSLSTCWGEHSQKGLEGQVTVRFRMLEAERATLE